MKDLFSIIFESVLIQIQKSLTKLPSLDVSLIRRKTEYLALDFQRIVYLLQVFILYMFRSSIISGQGG